jgi:hypothetical protein
MRQEEIAGKLLTRMAGSPQQAFNAVQGIRAGGARTPGMTLTAGQMGGNVGLSAMEDAIAAQNAAGELSNKVRQQNAVLAKQLRKISGTAEDIEAATKKVSERSDPRYEAARKAGFVPETYSPEMKEIKELERLNIPNFWVTNKRKGTYPTFPFRVLDRNIVAGTDEKGYEICVYDLEGNLLKKIKKEY